MVRPDCVAITPQSDGQGRVQSRLFEGMHYLYGVALSSGMVHSLATHTNRYEMGDTVQVTLEPDHHLTCFWDGRSQSCGGRAVTPEACRRLGRPCLQRLCSGGVWSFEGRLDGALRGYPLR